MLLNTQQLNKRELEDDSSSFLYGKAPENLQKDLENSVDIKITQT